MKQIQFIKQTFWITEGIRNETAADLFVHLFLERTDELKPDIWYGGVYTKNKNQKIDENTETIFRKALYDNKILQLSFGNSSNRRKKNCFNFSIGIIPNRFNDLMISISHEYFQNQENLNIFLNIFAKITTTINCMYGLIHDMSDSLRITQNRPYDILNKVPDIFWGNYFGSEYISKLGENKLLSVEAFVIKRISNGIYIQLTDSPFNFNDKKTEKMRQKIKKQIGLKYFGYNKEVMNLYTDITGNK